MEICCQKRISKFNRKNLHKKAFDKLSLVTGYYNIIGCCCWFTNQYIWCCLFGPTTLFRFQFHLKWTRQFELWCGTERVRISKGLVDRVKCFYVFFFIFNSKLTYKTSIVYQFKFWNFLSSISFPKKHEFVIFVLRRKYSAHCANAKYRFRAWRLFFVYSDSENSNKI